MARYWRPLVLAGSGFRTRWACGLALATIALPAFAQTSDIPPAASPCLEIPEPYRWLPSALPDVGRDPPLISAHRGAVTLAPENSLWAYRYAMAYEVQLVEVDVRQTNDHQFVAFHDTTIDNKTDGSGRIEDLSLVEVRQLNAADYEPWRGGEYDPAQIATLAEVLELVESAGYGIEFDMKFMIDSQPDADLAGFAAQVNEYPALLRRSIINLPPPVAQVAQALIPEGRFIYNLLINEPPALLYPITQLASVFGSRLEKFSTGSMAAVHDGCALVMPHSYDEGADDEGEQILLARALGADGVQTNQPPLARALLVGPVATELRRNETGQVCLVNPSNGFGLPGKTLRHADGTTLTTGLAGCVSTTDVSNLSFAGDASAAAAHGPRRGDSQLSQSSAGGLPSDLVAGAWLLLLRRWLIAFLSRRRLGSSTQR